MAGPHSSLRSAPRVRPPTVSKSDCRRREHYQQSATEIGSNMIYYQRTELIRALSLNHHHSECLLGLTSLSSKCFPNPHASTHLVGGAHVVKDSRSKAPIPPVWSTHTDHNLFHSLYLISTSNPQITLFKAEGVAEGVAEGDPRCDQHKIVDSIELQHLRCTVQVVGLKCSLGSLLLRFKAPK